MSSLSTSTPNTDRQGLAVILIITTALAISFGDVLVKIISHDIVVWQMFVLRSLIVVPVLILMSRLRPEPISLIPKNLGWTLIRTLCMVLMWLVYYAALLKLPISDVAAAYYTMPIMLSLLAAIIIGDKIGVKGWLGVIIGFIGVLIIVKPNNTAFSIYILLPLIAAFLFALAMIITRTKCRKEHPFILTLNVNFTFLLVGIAATVFIENVGGIEQKNISSFFGDPWKSLNTREWIAVITLAVIMLFVSIGGTIAYQVGKSAVVGTISFSYIPFAAIWAFLLLNETPSMTSIVGIILIIIAGVLTVWK